MADGHPLVISSKAGRKRGRGVAMHEHDVSSVLSQHTTQTQQDVAGDVGQVLAWLHQIQIEVGLDVEKTEHLVEHLAVLGGDTDADFETRIRLQVFDQGGHLDGLGAGTKYE